MATATGTTRTARPKAAAAPKVEEAPVESEQQIKNRLRNEAEREVIDRHRAELHEIAEAKFIAAGLVYTRRKTEQEKAADKVKALLEQFPELASQFAAVPVTSDHDPEEADPEEADPEEEHPGGYDTSLGYTTSDEDSPGWPSDEPPVDDRL